MRSSAWTGRVAGWAAVLAASVLAGGPLLAGPLDKTRVDGEARWVVHVDLEAAMASTFGTSIRQAYDTAIDVLQHNHPARMPPEGGIDLLRDIRGATFYGFEITSCEGVLALDGTAALDGLFEHLERQVPGFQRISGDVHPTYTWPEGDAKRYATIREAGDDRVVILAPDRRTLDRGIAVLGGAVPTLALADTPPLSQAPRRGSMLFIAADGLNLAGGGREAAMLSRLTSALALDIGEAGDQVYAEVSMTARSDREADAMVQIIHGMLAIAQVKVHDEPELMGLAPMLSAVGVEKEGRRITTRVATSAAMLREVLSGLSAFDLMCDESPKPALPMADPQKTGEGP